MSVACASCSRRSMPRSRWLSFHLRVTSWKDAGLVTDRREGRWSYYALQGEALDRIAGFAQAVKPGEHAGSCRAACCP